MRVKMEFDVSLCIPQPEDKDQREEMDMSMLAELCRSATAGIAKHKRVCTVVPKQSSYKE